MKFNLKVHAGLSEGWMVLYERNGKTDVGLIANDLVSPDVIQEKITLDVYSSLNGEAMNGARVRVVYSMSTKPEVVYLVSDQEIMGVDPVSLRRFILLTIFFMKCLPNGISLVLQYLPDGVNSW